MATAAFSVIKDKMLVAPGIIVPHALAMYNASKTMKHFLLLPPFLWEGRLETIALEDRTVAWLLTVPISDQELRLANAESVAVLEEIFENKQIDIFDLARVSVVWASDMRGQRMCGVRSPIAHSCRGSPGA
jgi:antitoxin YqcF